MSCFINDRRRSIEEVPTKKTLRGSQGEAGVKIDRRIIEFSCDGEPTQFPSLQREFSLSDRERVRGYLELEGDDQVNSKGYLVEEELSEGELNLLRGVFSEGEAALPSLGVERVSRESSLPPSELTRENLSMLRKGLREERVTLSESDIANVRLNLRRKLP